MYSQYLPGWIKQVIAKLFTETLQGPFLSLLNRDKEMIISNAVTVNTLDT